MSETVGLRMQHGSFSPLDMTKWILLNDIFCARILMIAGRSWHLAILNTNTKEKG